MNYDEATVDLVRQALLITLKISAPILIAGIAVGLIIAIFQAVTSIQEQTLTFVPKLLAMLVVAVLLIPWIVTRLLEFSVSMFTNF
ncbi:MAG: flagellar biosynthesis protein FliQ [Phycisphaerales bacterium]|nr:flagellar biosynthesis protein FliQ [Phycisphaerales bacterium]